MAEERLQVCEQKFKASYGADMERVAALKGSSGNEAALMARLNLVQVALLVSWIVVLLSQNLLRELWHFTLGGTGRLGSC